MTIIVEVTVARERDQGTATDTEGIENLRSSIRPDIGGLQGGPFWHDEPKRAVQGTFQRHTYFFLLLIIYYNYYYYYYSFVKKLPRSVQNSLNSINSRHEINVKHVKMGNVREIGYLSHIIRPSLPL